MAQATSPQPIRRVVIANKNGKPSVVSDTQTVRTFDNHPAFANTLLWATPSQPKVGNAELAADPVQPTTNFLPPVGGTRLMIVTFPPDALMGDPSFDGAAFGAEVAQKHPDWLKHSKWTIRPCTRPIPSTTPSFWMVKYGWTWARVRSCT